MSTLDTVRDRAAFLALLEPALAQRLEARRDSACGLWPDLTIAYVNPAWQRFARSNGAGGGFSARWCEGANFLDGVGTPLREYYRQHLAGALEGRSSWTSEYECSSPRMFRLYEMEVRSVGQGAGLLVLHTRLQQRPHEPGLGREPIDATAWQDEHGLIHQCVHCRRVRRAGADEVWDWVPQWVERVPDNATGSLCPPCIASRYPDLAKGA